MKKATFIIPTADNQGRKFPAATMDGIQQEILREFGGFTVREVTGGWVDEQGKSYIEQNLEYTIVMDDEAIERLAQWLEKVKGLLSQKEMWLEAHETETYTI